jgi:hypothetical protein
MKLYMFRTVRLSIIRIYSLYTQQLYRSYRLVDGFRAGPGILPFLGGERKVNSEYVFFCYIFPHSSPHDLYETLRICPCFYNWKMPLSFIYYTVKTNIIVLSALHFSSIWWVRTCICVPYVSQYLVSQNVTVLKQSDTNLLPLISLSILFYTFSN